LKAYILCNKHDARINLEKTVIEALEAFENDYGVGVLQNKLKQRVVYKEALVKGLGVYELKDKKAKKEMVSLVEEIQDLIS